MPSLSLSDLRRALYGDPEDELAYLQAIYDNSLDINGGQMQRAGDLLWSGQETMPRDDLSTTITLTSGTLRASCFTARKTASVGTLRVITGGTAGAGLTLGKLALYEISRTNHDATLLGQTANDTAMFTANTRVSKALTAPVNVVQGKRYATAILAIGTTPPNICATVASSGTGMTTEMNEFPRFAFSLAGQSDIPSSIVAANQNNLAQRFYAALV